VPQKAAPQSGKLAGWITSIEVYADNADDLNLPHLIGAENQQVGDVERPFHDGLGITGARPDVSWQLAFLTNPCPGSAANCKTA
jgi:hypothetical protein